MLERAAWPFSISQGGAPAPALSFFFLPPYPPHFQPERKKELEMEAERELLVQVQEVNTAKRAQFGLLCPSHVSG